MNISEVSDSLKTNVEHGLSQDEAVNRLKVNGPNEIPKVKRSFIRIYLAPLFNWLIVIYLIGSLVLFFASIAAEEKTRTSTLYLTLGIVLINCLIAVFQQLRATKKLKALQQMSAPKSFVIRGGNTIEILTKDVVIGDILTLKQGDKVAADARLIKLSNLELNESSLTGESEPVKKATNTIENNRNEELSLQDQNNMVFYGTYVTLGSGVALVVKTGPNTEIGKISRGLKEAGISDIPLQKKMNHFGKRLGLIVVLFWLMIFLIIWIGTGEMNLFMSLNSAMDIMPINIPLLTTIVLITGVLGMAKQGVIIRNITSVDSLGRISLICTDKTGTLTQNKMFVEYAWLYDRLIKITGNGYEPKGDLFDFGPYTNDIITQLIKKPSSLQANLIKDVSSDFALSVLIKSAYLNNNASYIAQNTNPKDKNVDKWNILGTPTEGALLAFAKKTGIETSVKNFIKIKEFPFDSNLKRMTSVYSNDSKLVSFSKGASERILPLCSFILINNEGVPISQDYINNINERILNFESLGYRVLSIAYSANTLRQKISSNDTLLTKLNSTVNLSNQESDSLRNAVESDLTYIGFLTILDPPRVGVAESINMSKNAGIDVVMVTGDSINTAKAIANQISLTASDRDLAFEGIKGIEVKEDTEFNKIKIFARVSPIIKENIVKRYQNQKKVVAMTGDGVNDTLALNMADVGISMGIQGTDIAKEAADMILTDDSFNSIVKGIEEGRGIFARIRAVVFFYICLNVFEGIVQFVLTIILDLPYFLSPEFYYQWVFLAVTVHTFPGLILTFDTVSKDVMKEKPRDSEEIITKKTVSLMVAFGGLLALSMCVVYFLGVTGTYPIVAENVSNPDYLYHPLTLYLTPGINVNHAKALTMLMVTLFFCETCLIFQIRRPNKSLLKAFKEDSNILMYLLIGFLFSLLLLIMYYPGLQVLLASYGINFMFMFLSAGDWIVCFLIACICIVSFELVKLYARRKGIVF
jgi:Ca2+-transporting ATPase